MPEPKQSTAAAWRLVLALLVCAVLLSFLRQRLVVERGLAFGHTVDVQRFAPTTWLVRGAAVLFVIGLLVRVTRWFSVQSTESARKARLEAAHPLVGAPQRVGGPRSSRSGRRSAPRH